MDNELAKEILLENLSFYEWMNIENILISITPADLVLIESLSLDEVKQILDILVKEGIVDKKHENKEFHYKRIHKKKNLKSKIMKYFK